MTEPAITKQAYHISAGSNLPVFRVVMHDEEYPVSNHSAEDVAQYFTTKASGGSAHYVEDADSEQHCVREDVIAWHAPPNQHSIGIEMDGYARFTSADWQTPGSQASLQRAAGRVAELCQRHSIPIAWLSVADLQNGMGMNRPGGITSHANMSAAFHQSDHTDPGPQFPVNQFLQLVHDASGGVGPAPTHGGIEVPNGKGFVQNPAGPGGWAWADDGGVFQVGPAPFFGSMGGQHMNAPVIGMVPTPTGKGYALVGADGGIFNFGDANWRVYTPFQTEYAAGVHRAIGADLAPDGHLVYVSDKLETYVL